MSDTLRQGYKRIEDETKLVKGESKLPESLKGPTGKDYRTKGGGTATEVVGTFNLPKERGYINAPLLVPGQTETKRILKGKKPKRDQVVRAVKYAKAHGAKHYKTISDAESAEERRHKKLEKFY